MKIVASIEARMGSSRLPGKVLAEIAGRPALGRMLDRLRRCRTLNSIVVATSTAPADDAIERFVLQEGVSCHRGSEDDVLRRVVEAHRSQGSDLIVELTGDCVLIDPEIVDMAVETFLANACDVVSTAHSHSFPNGTDTQVFSFSSLAEVAATIDDPAVHEHVSLYFYEHPERYRVVHLAAPARWKAPECRLVLDYPEDLQLIRAVFDCLYPLQRENFGTEDILKLLREHPEIAALNSRCVNKAVR